MLVYCYVGYETTVCVLVVVDHRCAVWWAELETGAVLLRLLSWNDAALAELAPKDLR